MEHTDELNLIEEYFHRNLSNSEILHYLKEDCGINISLSTLKRRLKRLNLRRWNNDEELDDAINFIAHELKNAGQMLGYRMLHLKCRQKGFQITRDTVSLAQQILDPEGVQQRKKKRLQRRLYSVKGPNYLWHLDGYDKVKPYGIAVHGCIDGFSRKLIWLEAACTNNDPKKVGNYYMDSVLKIQGCPISIRSDYGTENTDVKIMQDLIREVFGETSFPAYLLGSSTSNQRIESFWGQLRKGYMQYYMNLFQSLKESGDFGGNDFDKSIIRFCFLRKIQDELNEMKELWNNHVIRKSKNGVMPTGKPINMYQWPQKYNTKDYVVRVPNVDTVVSILKEQFQYVDRSCDSEVHELLNLIMEERNLNMPSDAGELKVMYVQLRNIFYNYLQN